MWSHEYRQLSDEEFASVLRPEDETPYTVIAFAVAAMGAYTGVLFVERALLQSLVRISRRRAEARRRKRRSEPESPEEIASQNAAHLKRARHGLTAGAVAFGLNTVWSAGFAAILGTSLYYGRTLSIVRFSVWETLLSLAGSLTCTLVAFLLAGLGPGSLTDVSSGVVEARYFTGGTKQAEADGGEHSGSEGASRHGRHEHGLATIFKKLRPNFAAIRRQLFSLYGLRLLLGGAILGIGIAWAHFAGLQAMRIHGQVVLEPLELVVLIATSLFIGIVVLFMMFHCHGKKARAFGSIAIAVLTGTYHVAAMRTLHVIPVLGDYTRGLFRVNPGSESEWLSGGQQLISVILVVSFATRFLVFTS